MILRRIKHRLMRGASWLPDRILLFLDHHWKWRDSADGFSFWTDASYWAYCRKDRKLHS